MRILLLFIFSFLLTSHINAQESSKPLSVKWGNELKSPSGTFIYKIVQNDLNGITVLRLKKSGMFSTSQKIIFERYNAGFGIEKSKETTLKYKNKSMDFEQAFSLGGKLYLFSSFANQKDQKKYLFGQEVRATSLTPEKKLSYLDEMPFTLLNDYAGFQFDISPDSSLLLVYHAIPGKKEEPAKYSLLVVDNELNKLWSTQYTLQGKLKDHFIENIKLDNKGNAFLLLSSNIGTGTQKLQDDKYRMISIRDQGQKIDEIDIGVSDIFINGLNFKVLKDNNIVLAGFYSNRGVNSVKGVVYYVINGDTKQIIHQSTKEFGFDFVTSNLSESKRNKLKDSTRKTALPELPKFNLDHLILRGDGGALLLAEQYDYSVYSYYDYFSRTYTNRYVYMYDDIVAVSINPEGNIDWATRVPKHQETMDDEGIYSSYCYAVSGDKLVFLYNDNPRNYNRDQKSRVRYEFDAYNGMPAYAIIESDGTLRTGLLENGTDDKQFIRPSICKQTALSKLLIYKEYNGRYKWGEVMVK